MVARESLESLLTGRVKAGDVEVGDVVDAGDGFGTVTHVRHLPPMRTFVRFDDGSTVALDRDEVVHEL